MEHAAARTLCLNLMAEHGLGPEWSFRWMRSARTFGRCRYNGGRLRFPRHLHYLSVLAGPSVKPAGGGSIELSEQLVALNGEAQVRDTILHEIAHALTPGAGHGLAWKRMAARIGARPERCYSAAEVAQPPAPWHLVCKVHGVVAQRRVRLGRKAQACRRCCRDNGGHYAPEFALEWHRAGAAVHAPRPAPAPAPPALHVPTARFPVWSPAKVLTTAQKAWATRKARASAANRLDTLAS